MKSVKPLAISTAIPNSIGSLHCFSIHDRVINLLNQQQQLITLHRHHNGISPMGMIIKECDFGYLHSLLLANQSRPIKQNSQGIVVNNEILISNNARKLQLQITQKFISSFTFIDQLIHQFDQPTGLFGSLKSIKKDKLPTELHDLSEQIALLLEGQSIDLSSIIGLGPGLTPTGDDIITGVLLLLFSDPFCSRLLDNLPNQFPLSLLEQQTTKVSANFLHYAMMGIFSANLLNVLHLMRNKRYTNLTAVNRLLSYGHTSGADLLLGMWLGSLILEKYKYG